VTTLSWKAEFVRHWLLLPVPFFVACVYGDAYMATAYPPTLVWDLLLETGVVVEVFLSTIPNCCLVF